MSGDAPNLPAGRDVRRAAALAARLPRSPGSADLRREAQPFLKLLAAMGKTVSNIPVIIVAVMERQARVSRHCLQAECWHVPGTARAGIRNETTRPGAATVSGRLAPTKQRYPPA